MDYNKLWEILKERIIPDHLTCLLRSLYTGQEATVRTRYGTKDWFQIEKGVHQGCMTDFIFLGSKITVDGEYSYWVKTLAPWKKSYDQPREHIKKQRHYFVDKVHLVKAMVFSVVMYGCESWAIKKSEHWRNDAFELWCWRVPWTARSNQSVIREISPEYSLKGWMLKLKLQYFGYLMWRANSLEKDFDAGEDWRQKEKVEAENEVVR